MPKFQFFLHDFENTRTDSTFKELDDPITQDEIKRAARKLKSNKACSLDTILNEIFKESINILIGPLEIGEVNRSPNVRTSDPVPKFGPKF